MVHASTISVYGQTADGDLDEDSPRRRSGDLYAEQHKGVYLNIK